MNVTIQDNRYIISIIVELLLSLQICWIIIISIVITYILI